MCPTCAGASDALLARQHTSLPAFLIALALAFLAMWPQTALADAPQMYLPFVGRIFFDRPVTWATVTKIVDGDTIWVDLDGDGAGDAKVRYLAINTPETTFGKHECYGAEATERNRALCAGQLVALERDVSDTDSYDRLLRYVYTVRGEWVNGQLVREGYARVTIYPPDRRYEAALYCLQVLARDAGAGAWGGGGG